MKRYTQTDPKWMNDSMALPDDTIGLYGCYLTALANILDFTPQALNIVCKERGLYLGKRFKDEESKINSVKLCQVLEISIKKVGIEYLTQFPGENIIIHYKHKYSPTGEHYSNYLYQKDHVVIVFDVFTGMEREVARGAILNIYAVFTG